ncbi:M20 family metallopeptidase [Alcaligenaceae bacterium A4P071]|nr:M20 family metallopeptidase [Alcaligenaceae bacterium C4P045]MDQ2185593.1 M20 family metallopeptidase [Alcaligenaceae bacterium A4P071]
MSRVDAVAAAVGELDSGRFAERLSAAIAVRSTSEEPDSAPAQHEYLNAHIVPLLADLGFDIALHANPSGADLPLLTATRIEDPAWPTVLVYGHGDVVQGQDAGWREGLSPWSLTPEGARWYGRGAADNKGQHLIVLTALQQVYAARDGKLGFNIKVLIETGEEAGSPGLNAFCAANRDLLAADVLIASDGPRLHAETPTLFLGSRGAVNFTLDVDLRAGAYHSGNWGGLLANPATVLVNALATMVDARGRILVEGLRPPPIPASVDRALAQLDVKSGEGEPAIDADWGEPGMTPAQRVFGWNSLEILALGAGRVDRPVNAIAGRAQAVCQLRFVVGTDWQNLQTHVQSHLDAAGFGVIKVATGASAAATRLDPDNAWVQWASASIAATTGTAPSILPNLGGSLPNDVFAGTLGLPTLWVPHSYAGCAQHAPNEHALEPIIREGLAMMAGLFWDMGCRDTRPSIQRGK